MACATRAPERSCTRPSKRELQKLLAMERHKGGGSADWSERLVVFPERVPDGCQKQTERESLIK